MQSNDEKQTISDEEDVIEGVVETSSSDETADNSMKLAELQQQLKEAQTKSAENLEGWQRTLADFANARRRFEKTQYEAQSNAKVELATELLPILDDFALAMGNVPANIAQDAWYKGVEMIPRKLQTILDRLSIEKIATVGHPFDPTLHNAIMSEKSHEYESGIIIREFQLGYKVGDRILRTAVVAVAA